MFVTRNAGGAVACLEAIVAKLGMVAPFDAHIADVGGVEIGGGSDGFGAHIFGAVDGEDGEGGVGEGGFFGAVGAEEDEAVNLIKVIIGVDVSHGATEGVTSDEIKVVVGVGGEDVVGFVGSEEGKVEGHVRGDD